MEHNDFIALGGGNAGLAAAQRVRRAGNKVALIDPTFLNGDQKRADLFGPRAEDK